MINFINYDLIISLFFQTKDDDMFHINHHHHPSPGLDRQALLLRHQALLSHPSPRISLAARHLSPTPELKRCQGL
jgi:hypothetical protein